ncbi:hypothetical protein G7046_g845 [Stylonectria norvegica]|nr:hypothetical protein G7046_g845 [Stylonectria norvegica]
MSNSDTNQSGQNSSTGSAVMERFLSDQGPYAPISGAVGSLPSSGTSSGTKSMTVVAAQGSAVDGKEGDNKCGCVAAQQIKGSRVGDGGALQGTQDPLIHMLYMYETITTAQQVQGSLLQQQGTQQLNVSTAQAPYTTIYEVQKYHHQNTVPSVRDSATSPRQAQATGLEFPDRGQGGTTSSDAGPEVTCDGGHTQNKDHLGRRDVSKFVPSGTWKPLNHYIHSEGRLRRYMYLRTSHDHPGSAPLTGGRAWRASCSPSYIPVPCQFSFRSPSFFTTRESTKTRLTSSTPRLSSSSRPSSAAPKFRPHASPNALRFRSVFRSFPVTRYFIRCSFQNGFVDPPPVPSAPHAYTTTPGTPATTLPPFADVAQLPACAVNCGALYDANGGCVPPAVAVAASSVYTDCFCANSNVAAFATGSTGVCDQACTTAGGLSSIAAWYNNFCKAANVAAKTTTTKPPVVTLTTSTTTSGSTSGSKAASNSGGGGTWLSGHWQWVIMIVILVVAITGIWIGACIWRRRYLRKKDRQSSLLQKHSGSASRPSWGPPAVDPSTGVSSAPVPYDPAAYGSNQRESQIPFTAGTAAAALAEKPAKKPKKDKKRWVVKERT